MLSISSNCVVEFWVILSGEYSLVVTMFILRVGSSILRNGMLG